MRHFWIILLLIAGKVSGEEGMEEKAYYAGGCFWGVEKLMEEVPGVLSTSCGYMGGNVENPTYEEVCSSKTGHAEAVEVTFDPTQTSYEELTRAFFEIHDPTQWNGQGPDLGPQYRSVIFTVSENQKEIAHHLIDILRDRGYDVVTEVVDAGPFYPAEEYHQKYYDKTGQEPYCHIRVKRF